MTKWHNGPKGPSICKATKGKCPFGGADSHFDSKEDAQKMFESQSEQTYGLLPGMSSESKVKPSVLAVTSDGIPMANSNYAYTGQGSEADREHFESKFNNPDMSAEEIVNSLNDDPKILGKYKKLIKTKEKMILRTFDAFGNEGELTVLFERPESEKPKREPGHISAYNPKTRIPESTSNFVSTLTLKTGTKGAQEHFSKIVNDSNYDASKLARALNKDEHVLGKWKVQKENNDVIVLQQKDSLGNLSEVNIQKTHVEKPKNPPKTPHDERPSGTGTIHSVKKGSSERNFHHMSEFVNVHKLGKGTEGAEQHLSDIIKANSSDKDVLVETLNKDKNIYGKWSLSRDFDDKVILECKRPGEGSAYLTVTK